MKSGKGKAAKKRMIFAERKPRIEKWLAEQEITGNLLIKAYRKKFAVDRLTAIDELKKLGKTFTVDEIEKEKQAARAYQEHKKRKREKKKSAKLEREAVHNLEQDEQFFFIAGYTSGGAPYGVTWEEMGMNISEDTTDGENDEDLFIF